MKAMWKALLFFSALIIYVVGIGGILLVLFLFPSPNDLFEVVLFLLFSQTGFLQVWIAQKCNLLSLYKQGIVCLAYQAAMAYAWAFVPKPNSVYRALASFSPFFAANTSLVFWGIGMLASLILLVVTIFKKQTVN